jgi:hypothetical protein
MQVHMGAEGLAAAMAGRRSWLVVTGARATSSKVKRLCFSTTMLVQRHLDGGVGGWLVHAGGSVVMLRVFPSFF